MTEITISNAPEKYQRYLTIGDAKGNFNQKVDAEKEAKIAAKEFCGEKSAEDCQKFLEYLEKSGYTQKQAKTISNEQKNIEVEKASQDDTKLFELELKLEQAEQIKDSFKKMHTVNNISHIILKAVGNNELSLDQAKQLFEKCLNVVRDIKDPSYKIGALIDIASSMKSAGVSKKNVLKIFKEAIETARAMKNQYHKSQELCDIAGAMAKNGIKKGITVKIFKEALNAAFEIDNLKYISRLAGNKTDFMVDEIFRKMVYTDHFDEALDLAGSIDSCRFKSQALNLIVREISCCAGFAGLDAENLEIYYNKVLEVAFTTIKHPFYKANLIKYIAFKVAEAGLDKVGDRKVYMIFASALLIAQDIDSSYYKSETIASIINSFRAAELKEVQTKSLLNIALESAQTIENMKERIETIDVIDPEIAEVEHNKWIKEQRKFRLFLSPLIASGAFGWSLCDGLKNNLCHVPPHANDHGAVTEPINSVNEYGAGGWHMGLTFDFWQYIFLKVQFSIIEKSNLEDDIKEGDHWVPRYRQKYASGEDAYTFIALNDTRKINLTLGHFLFTKHLHPAIQHSLSLEAGAALRMFNVVRGWDRYGLEIMDKKDIYLWGGTWGINWHTFFPVKHMEISPEIGISGTHYPGGAFELGIHAGFSFVFTQGQ